MTEDSGDGKRTARIYPPADECVLELDYFWCTFRDMNDEERCKAMEKIENMIPAQYFQNKEARKLRELDPSSAGFSLETLVAQSLWMTTSKEYNATDSNKRTGLLQYLNQHDYNFCAQKSVNAINLDDWMKRFEEDFVQQSGHINVACAGDRKFIACGSILLAQSQCGRVPDLTVMCHNPLNSKVGLMFIGCKSSSSPYAKENKKAGYVDYTEVSHNRNSTSPFQMFSGSSDRQFTNRTKLIGMMKRIGGLVWVARVHVVLPYKTPVRGTQPFKAGVLAGDNVSYFSGDKSVVIREIDVDIDQSNLDASGLFSPHICKMVLDKFVNKKQTEGIAKHRTRKPKPTVLTTPATPIPPPQKQQRVEEPIEDPTSSCPVM